ncbi:PepSY domain-containing protein [Lacinutrix jangbogonensis]|uniref:PepSY domain-containing protein n=1 Tax=Lacinutrix jangbogonensis TaxID=1469557 RepID=UPI00068A8628|nr:PepSY domain-containing protein [Lacinutrix jangbogonensis]
MTLSIWRYSHLLLAISSAIFLIIVSITGIILAFEPINNAVQPYAIKNIKNVSVAETISALENEYSDVLEFEVTASDFVMASVVSKNGESESIYINPSTGKKLGNVAEKAPIFSWSTNLHRSLFLKGIGRFFVGFVSLLLCFIAVTGFLLLIKRQGGILKLYTKVIETNLEQRYHVILGRWLLIPIIIIAVSGVYLSAEKFSLLPETTINHNWSPEVSEEFTKKELSEFELFKNINLDELRKLSFPFSEDSEDYFEIELQNKSLLVHQYSGEVISEVNHPFTTLASRLSMQLHTGESSVLWSLVLLISGISILFFIYSGFSMTLKRRKNKNQKLAFSNKNDSEYIVLVGSETGSTFIFAEAFCKALIHANKKVFLSTLNDYTTYNNAKHLVVFTATYGAGDAPSNARHFKTLLNSIKPVNTMQFSVVGFGSLLYPEYCRFGITVDNLLQMHSNFKPILFLTKINEQSNIAFNSWVKQWSQITGLYLDLKLPQTKTKKRKLRTFKVVGQSNLNSDNTFLLKLQPSTKVKFQSGDLITIVPKKETTERQYSIAKVNNTILLSIKKHDKGICSSYLSTLKKDETIRGYLKDNNDFHFPKKASQILLIANGTGIAPFLGMLDENKSKITTHLFLGLRTKASFKLYQEHVFEMLSKKKLVRLEIAYSQEEQKQYIQDLLFKESALVSKVLEDGGIIMICGSLAMKHSVLDTLEVISKDILKRPLSDFENNEQLKTDCY